MCKEGYAGRDCLRLSDMMHSYIYICADQQPSATCNDDKDVDHEDEDDEDHEKEQ